MPKPTTGRLPSRSGHSDIPGRERSALSRKKRRGDDIHFDDEEFSKWMGGIHKRKQERIVRGHKQAADKIKEEKNADRREAKQQMKNIVQQHFGEVIIEDDGRVITTKNGYGDFSGSESDEPTTTVLKRGKGGKVLHEEKHDSITAIKSESVKSAQFSFNTTRTASDIAKKVKNSLLSNLDSHPGSEKYDQFGRSNDGITLQSVNFENDDSIITVETTDMQGNLQTAINLRKKRQQAARNLTPAPLQDAKPQPIGMGKNFGQTPGSKRIAQHSISIHANTDTNSDDTDDEEIIAIPTALYKNMRNKNTKRSAVDTAKNQKYIQHIDINKATQDLDGDSSDYSDSDLEVVKSDDDDDNDNDNDNNESDLDNVQNASADEENWQIIDENIITDIDSESEDEADKLHRLKIKKQLEAEDKRRVEILAQAKKAAEQQQEKALQKSRQIEVETKTLNKKQKKNKGDDEHEKNKELVSLLTHDMMYDDIQELAGAAKPVSMAVASPYFMLPQPKAWVEEKERKERLKNSNLTLLDNSGSVFIDQQAPEVTANGKKRKLDTLEALQHDPTYGWEEGETSRERDLNDIFGIPAASMGGRYRKKPLSDKNKKKSSDARKEKKNMKKRDKEDKFLQMSFETGFADSNTTGKKINFDDDDRMSGKSTRERRQIQRKQDMRLEKAHKKGKMIGGKYYFGQKDGSVNM